MRTTPSLSKLTSSELDFVETIWGHYRQHGRHELPWRKTTDPYCILVSELMLQQTQVKRVLPKYHTFLATYPTIRDLAKARLADVLQLWQGLGYNRRAKYLLACSREVVERLDGVLPANEEALQQLPGIGPYTAAAICAFAYNQPVTLIETNVRQVYIHHFFAADTVVDNKAIASLVEKTVPRDCARDWYAALMDYGTYLKARDGNNTKVIKGYRKQTVFEGSDRQVRGALLRSLLEGPATKARLIQTLGKGRRSQIVTQLDQLIQEGLVQEDHRLYSLP